MKARSILLTLIMVSFICGCKEEERGQYALDSIPPGEIKNPQVENVPGGAIISYTIPDDEDLLYVRALYTLDNGQEMEQKASAYTNSLKIEGFGRAREVEVKLIAGDRSKNESEAVIVKANPLDAPIYSILESVDIEADFGGIRLDWENPDKADVVLSVITHNSEGKLVTAENFYTNSPNGRGALRGYANTERLFGVYLRDRWGNLTDTIRGNYLPLFEEELKGPYSRWNPTGIPYVNYASYHIENMWDGSPATFYIQNTLGYPHSFTFDLRRIIKISRFKQWQRQGASLIYNSQNIKKFELWGSATPGVTDDFSGWTKLGEYESHKPSGEVGRNTQEDTDFAAAGEDFAMDPAAPPVRYIRYVILNTWSGDANAAIAEIKFFGEIQ